MSLPAHFPRQRPAARDSIAARRPPTPAPGVWPDNAARRLVSEDARVRNLSCCGGYSTVEGREKLAERIDGTQRGENAMNRTIAPDSAAGRRVPHAGTRLAASLCAAFIGAAAIPSAPAADDASPIPSYVLAQERNTIEIFRRAADSVVFITNALQRRSLRTLDIATIPQGTGSGIIWDAQGHVVTNLHVIQGGNAFSVTFSDGTTRAATVVGVDPNKDLAVLKIQADGIRLVPIARGISKELVVGQKVLAIGNPFGLDHTLTVGVISALGREIHSIEGTTIVDVIQTDASINPGNSGGPLLDSSGHMIGLNTQIISRSGQSAGIGFAVPIDTMERIAPQLIRYGRVRRAGLGVQILRDNQIRHWGVQGVVIRDVQRDSPAAKAGLRSMVTDRRGNVISYDLITGVDRRSVTGYDDLYQALDGRKPGDQITVQYRRGGRDHELALVLTSLD